MTTRKKDAREKISVRLRALRNPASHMSERVSQTFETFIRNQWHVAQFLLRVGSIWCKHELLAAWSGALSKTKLTTHWLLFPFGLFFEWFFFLPPQCRRSDCHFVAASLERPSRCLCHVPLGNGLRWFPWKGGRCVLHLCLNSITLFGGKKKKVWSWWACEYCNHSAALQQDLLYKASRGKPLTRKKYLKYYSEWIGFKASLLLAVRELGISDQKLTRSGFEEQSNGISLPWNIT